MHTGEYEHDPHCACFRCYERRRRQDLPRVVKGPVRRRLVSVEGQTMVAFDAHDLLDATTEIGRPGTAY